MGTAASAQTSSWRSTQDRWAIERDLRRLGQALLERAPELIDTVASRGDGGGPGGGGKQARDAIGRQFVHLGTIATIAVGRWLSGESVDVASAAGEEFSRVAAQLIAASDVTLGEVVRRCRYWRDGCDLALRECAEQEGVCDEALAAARESIGRAADRALAQMSVLFDREREQIEAELASQQRQLAYLATHDALTSLANRALIGQTLERMLACAGKTRSEVAVLFIDLDNFKVVNDTYGHEAGDEVLVAIANRLAEAAGGDGTLGRLGGDEFVVLTGGAEADIVAARVIEAFEDPFSSRAAESLEIGASVGIAVSSPGSTAQELLKAADLAMYSAKLGG